MENSITNLAVALINAQEDLKNTVKDKQGYGYKYTELSTVLQEVKPTLKKYDLVVVQLPISKTEDGKLLIGVKNILIHKSGESLESELLLPVPEIKQATVTQTAGAALTYARRYSLASILGIASDEDTDGTLRKEKEEKEEEVKKISHENFIVLKGLISKLGKDEKVIKNFLKVNDLLSISDDTAKRLIKKFQDEVRQNEMTLKADEVNLDEIEKGIEAQNIKN